MKSFVLDKTRYIITNSWLGLLLPAGVHQLLNYSEKTSSAPEKSYNSYRAHPAESRNLRNFGGRNRP